MPRPDVPAFDQSLADLTSVHLALLLLILTGQRSKPVRFLHLDQIDADVWTVPAELLKGREGKTEDLRVALCTKALADRGDAPTRTLAARSGPRQIALRRA